VHRLVMPGVTGPSLALPASWPRTPARAARSRGKISRCLPGGSSAGIAKAKPRWPPESS